ncbi:MAG: tRNA 2-thiouridine(34) synthase MnmA [Alphaproteobacteria bacterium]|nr:tRNA 2-thiouridine(34) synthase MnmA [Alphaproteobacteria bacterium]
MLKLDFALDGIKPGGRVAVAMSGGVDSSVAAGLMVEAGYDVVGITLQLYDQGAMAAKKKACCAGQDIYDARSVADHLNFPHYVLDYETVFRQSVIEDFVDSYSRGETPIPCVRCNQQVKFKDLLSTARDLGADALVTGHYVRRVASPDGAHLYRGIDSNRDQSYFLFTTTQDELDYLRFPLGDISKTVTRDIARRLGLTISEKPDSQDICFVPAGGYAEIVAKYRPGALDPGDIVHIDGRVLGTHKGIIHYTIGQRKGLGVSAPEPLYVIRLDPAERRVVVGPYESLAITTITLKDVNWLVDPQMFKGGYSCQVKIRSTHQPISATVQYAGPTSARVTFKDPEYGVAFGQACVFIENGPLGDRILGGGWITNHA